MLEEKGGINIPESRTSWKKKEDKNTDIPTAADLYSGQGSKEEDDKCIFCLRKHESSGCYQAQQLSMEFKQVKFRESKACFCCLKRGHVSRM